MAGVGSVIAKGFVDGRNLFVGSCSGGGVLSAGSSAHRRFAAAAVRCPVTDWLVKVFVPLFGEFLRRPVLGEARAVAETVAADASETEDAHAGDDRRAHTHADAAGRKYLRRSMRAVRDPVEGISRRPPSRQLHVLRCTLS